MIDQLKSMSSNPENEVTRRSLLAPGTQLLEKPLEPQALRRKARRVVEDPAFLVDNEDDQ